ncbi:hypothetical protein Bca52824_066661 [Brassica carinata]|uniref:Uncharacterized protein n=1 Tax=Brassica carinata TaxID=52824 RepID=A0A8X7UDL1_BRACI|nr:hypothetical protein Bca52824_066661 [Brassica carinata]
MSDLPPYPALDPIPPPTTSSSSAPDSVLHLDPNPFYGSHSASLSLPDLTSFLHSPLLRRRQTIPTSSPSISPTDPYTPPSRKFNVDLCGPRSVDASFIGDSSGELRSVPDSRGAIFKDKSLTLVEKRQLMKFFKLTWLLLPRWRAMRGRLRLRRKIWRVRLLSSWLRCTI